jgi:hypothetical protein
MRIRFSAVRVLVGVSLLTGLSACIFTSPTVPAELRRTSKGEQIVAPNGTAAIPLTVTVRDQDGDAKENVTIVWTIKSGSGSLSAEQTETNGDGVASVSFTAGASTGTTVVLASQPELAASVSFTVKVQ